MSVLIKDIDIPKDRELLLRIDEKGQVYIYGEYPTKIYKAIELPPHGRLIDADAYSIKLIEIIERQKYDDFYTQNLSVGEILRTVVDELRGMGLDGFNNAPTIIESEGE